MPEVNFKSLQSTHESLLQKQQKVTEKTQGNFASEVKTYIEQAKQVGSNIASTRERDQVRANLRYWANYVYGIEGVFPDTELAPSTVTGSQSFWASSLGKLTIWGFVLVVLMGAGSYLFGGGGATSALTPTGTSTLFATAPVEGTSTTEATTPEDATPTSESSGINVSLSSPANGDFITPNVEFSGTFENLKPGWAIHVLFIKGDKYFPIKENYPIPEKPTSNEWKIQTQIMESPEEMSTAQSYSVVLVASINDSTREVLSNSSETGIEIKSLPDTVLPFDNTARVIYRDPFVMVRETRLIYSKTVGKSYDIYTSKLDGSDSIQITDTPEVSELWSQLSPDGKHIVFVKYVLSTDLYTLAIMDSNGLNEYEIINSGENPLENPQWSPDSSFVSYALGDTTQSANATYWSIHTYQLASGEDKNISGEAGPHILNRYHSWLPDSTDIIFNSGTRATGTSGFIRTSTDSAEQQTLFFDTTAEEVQPSINRLENGYILTYTTIDPDSFLHEIYVVVDTDELVPFDGLPIKLTSENYGADFPTFDPNSNTVYYLGTGNNIYAVQINIEESTITLGAETLVIENDRNERISDFDIGFMEAFFPIP